MISLDHSSHKILVFLQLKFLLKQLVKKTPKKNLQSNSTEIIIKLIQKDEN